MRLTVAFALALLLTSPLLADDSPLKVQLWPATPPGETKTLPPEENITKPDDHPVGGRPIIKLTNVSTPELWVYPAPEEKRTGLAVVICPGGGHRILAFDHEGTEAAEWLNTLGVTGIVLKYRVPARDPNQRWKAAVQDAQRAMSLVRSRAKEWKIDSDHIGLLGFSAGGQTAALATLLSTKRHYAAEDETDQVSCRPDFAVLLYPGGLVTKEHPDELIPEVQVDKSTPPMFIVHAGNDHVPVQNSVLLYSQLYAAGVPAELHVYASGGHGYGIRKTGHPINRWPQRLEDWLVDQKWLPGTMHQ